MERFPPASERCQGTLAGVQCERWRWVGSRLCRSCAACRRQDAVAQQPLTDEFVHLLSLPLETLERLALPGRYVKGRRDYREEVALYVAEV